MTSSYPSKNWMDLPRYGKEFIDGVNSFLDFAYSVGNPQGEEIQCPCKEEDAFMAVFGKDQPGRVRCYGRSVTASSLKKDEEITKLKEKHADEVTTMKEKMQDLKEEVQELRKLQEMKEEIHEKQWQNFMKILVQNNPGLNIPDVAGCMGSNLPSPIDASSGRTVKSQNHQHSHGSTHSPSFEKENHDDEIGDGD